MIDFVIPYVRKYISKNIIVITNMSKSARCTELNTEIIDEDDVLNGFTYDEVAKIFYKYGGDETRIGWYYQQLLKLFFALRCSSKGYIVWDSDTIPLKSIKLHEKEKPILIEKSEYHRPYFDTINRLTGSLIYRNNNNISYIAECMYMNVIHVKKALSLIDNNLDPLIMTEKIFKSIDLKNINKSGFSEYEYIGNYYAINNLNEKITGDYKTYRAGSFLAGKYPKRHIIDSLSGQIDIITFEQNTKITLKHICEIMLKLKIRPINVIKIAEVMRCIIYKLKGQSYITYDKWLWRHQ